MPRGTCFIDIPDVQGNKWGWSIGPFGEGTYMFKIYAGAGQCDIGKGTEVGALTVVYSGGSAAVTYAVLAGSGYFWEEIQFYVGKEIMPRADGGDFTTSPGQYPVVIDPVSGGEQSSITRTIVSLSGDVYVVAHANACGLPIKLAPQDPGPGNPN